MLLPWIWQEIRFVLWIFLRYRRKVTFVDPIRQWLVRGYVWDIEDDDLGVVVSKGEALSPYCRVRRSDRGITWLPGHIFDQDERAALRAAYRLSASDERDQAR